MKLWPVWDPAQTLGELTVPFNSPRTHKALKIEGTVSRKDGWWGLVNTPNSQLPWRGGGGRRGERRGRPTHWRRPARPPAV